jgi:hypothetical protein
MTFILYGILNDAEAELAMAVGDPVLVTDSGYECLTTLSRELVIKQV